MSIDIPGVTTVKSLLLGDEELYPAIQMDGELLEEFESRCRNLADDGGGELLLIRPPRENEGMDASVSIYETLHNPRQKKIGLGPLSAIKTDSHIHAHEIWYHDGKMQFHMRPHTQVDANQIRRQIRSNYPNSEIRVANKRFPPVDVGEYVSVAELGLKRDFYFPIKSKLVPEDNFELDPYGDITTDMVVEEDETSTGEKVEAKDCKLIVQTTFEAARNIWNEKRPYGMDVSKVAVNMKEGEVHGNVASGYEVRSPSKLKKKTADIVDALRGTKAYYFNIRIIAISPYKEIAQRRCYTVSQDFEKYYNSITQQGLRPVELNKNEMKKAFLNAASREHDIPFRQRFMSNGKMLQPVNALAAMAHIPNEDINTPVVDWAKQDTGPGTPAETTQIEEQERLTDDGGERGKKDFSPTPGEKSEDAGTAHADSIEGVAGGNTNNSAGGETNTEKESKTDDQIQQNGGGRSDDVTPQQPEQSSQSTQAESDVKRTERGKMGSKEDTKSYEGTISRGSPDDPEESPGKRKPNTGIDSTRRKDNNSQRQNEGIESSDLEDGNWSPAFSADDENTLIDEDSDDDDIDLDSPGRR